MAVARIVETQTGKLWTPIFQDPLKAAIAQPTDCKVVWHERDAEPVHCRFDHQRLIGQRQSSRNVDPFGAPSTFKLPAVDCTALKSESNAIVME